MFDGRRFSSWCGQFAARVVIVFFVHLVVFHFVFAWLLVRSMNRQDGGLDSAVGWLFGWPLACGLVTSDWRHPIVANCILWATGAVVAWQVCSLTRRRVRRGAHRQLSRDSTDVATGAGRWRRSLLGPAFLLWCLLGGIHFESNANYRVEVLAVDGVAESIVDAHVRSNVRGRIIPFVVSWQVTEPPCDLDLSVHTEVQRELDVSLHSVVVESPDEKSNRGGTGSIELHGRSSDPRRLPVTTIIPRFLNSDSGCDVTIDGTLKRDGVAQRFQMKCRLKRQPRTRHVRPLWLALR